MILQSVLNTSRNQCIRSVTSATAASKIAHLNSQTQAVAIKSMYANVAKAQYTTGSKTQFSVFFAKKILAIKGFFNQDFNPRDINQLSYYMLLTTTVLVSGVKYIDKIHEEKERRVIRFLQNLQA